MKLKTVLQRIPYWYAAKKCVYLKSPPGRGKTTTLERAPAMLSARLNKTMGLVLINGGLLNEMDAVGYLVPRHREEYAESLFTRPFWWITREGKTLNEYDGGLIIVDEADKMPVEAKKVIGEAALSRRLGPHELPPGWVVWMAGNRQKDRSGSTKELDHLINRRMEIDIEDDIESFFDFCNENGVLPLTMHFAKENTQIVFASELPKDQGPWCTPRSLVAADEYLRMLTPPGGEFPTDNIVKEEIAGMIGAPGMSQYFASVKLDREMPSFEKIIKDPTGTKVPEAADARMLVAYKLAHMVDEETSDPVLIYVDRLPKEFATTFANAACKRKPSLVSTKAFHTWAKQNSALMAAISR